MGRDKKYYGHKKFMRKLLFSGRGTLVETGKRIEFKVPATISDAGLERFSKNVIPDNGKVELVNGTKLFVYFFRRKVFELVYALPGWQYMPGDKINEISLEHQNSLTHKIFVDQAFGGDEHACEEHDAQLGILIATQLFEIGKMSKAGYEKAVHALRKGKPNPDSN